MTTPQVPLGSGFSAFSTIADILATSDLSGKTAIVTGGYSGLGLQTARALSAAGARVIVPARDTARASEALCDLPGVALAPLDLMHARSIDAFAQHVVDCESRLDILVNCAGIMAAPLRRDAAGHESQFSTNHLGHFRLTLGLWPALLRAGAARVVSLSSRGHQISGIDFDDVDFERRAYDKWIAYGQSKTANALFALALDARGEADGIRAFSVHPGSILGPLARHLTEREIAAFGVHDDGGNPVVAPERDLKTASQGAATIAWCATSSRLDGMGGVYCENCDIAALEPIERRGVRPWAADPDAAERLWRLSEELTGVRLAA